MIMVTQIGVVRPVYMEGVGEAGPSSSSMYSEVGEAAGVSGSGELPRLDDIPNVFVLEGLEGNRGVVYIIDAGVGPVGSTRRSCRRYRTLCYCQLSTAAKLSSTNLHLKTWPLTWMPKSRYLQDSSSNVLQG